MSTPLVVTSSSLPALAALPRSPSPAPSAARARPPHVVRLTAGRGLHRDRRRSSRPARADRREARLWRLDAGRPRRPSGLRARGAVAFAQREHTYEVAAVTDTPEPLQADEWWLSQIGLEGVTPPGPGVPVTIVDSGLDVTHPEFAGRADTLALNAQEPAPLGGEHGTKSRR